MIGVIVMLMFAGLLEGFGRQLITDDWTRYAIATAKRKAPTGSQIYPKMAGDVSRRCTKRSAPGGLGLADCSTTLIR